MRWRSADITWCSGRQSPPPVHPPSLISCRSIWPPHLRLLDLCRLLARSPSSTCSDFGSGAIWRPVSSLSQSLFKSPRRVKTGAQQPSKNSSTYASPTLRLRLPVMLVTFGTKSRNLWGQDLLQFIIYLSLCRHFFRHTQIEFEDYNSKLIG
jgi:hypothetical protein